MLAVSFHRAEQLGNYIANLPNAAYNYYEIMDIIDTYKVYGLAAKIDWVLLFAQNIHETNWLRSYWSRPPRRNPAGIGVTGRPGAGKSFSSWHDAVKAHTGLVLQYALHDTEMSDDQLYIVQNCGVKTSMRGRAKVIKGFEGTWALDTTYSTKLAKAGNLLLAY